MALNIKPFFPTDHPTVRRILAKLNFSEISDNKNNNDRKELEPKHTRSYDLYYQKYPFDLKKRRTAPEEEKEDEHLKATKLLNTQKTIMLLNNLS